jgi:hypothetical protein
VTSDRLKTKSLARCLGLSAVCTLLTLLIFPRVYLENDDLGFVYLLGHGFYAPWIAKPLCLILLTLYTQAPGVGWYGLFHYLILALDLGVLFYLVDSWGTEKGFSQRGRWWLILAAFLLFYPFVLRITFTCSSIWTGGLALIGFFMLIKHLSAERESPLSVDSPFSAVFRATLGLGLMLAMAYLIRPEGLGALVFLAPIMLYAGLMGWKILLTRRGFWLTVIFLSPLLAAIFLDCGLMRYPADQRAYQQYVAASNNAFGFAYTEQFKDHPEWLATAGWRRNDYVMLENFLAWDESVYALPRINQLLHLRPLAIKTRLGELARPSMLLRRCWMTFAKVWLSNYPFTIYCLGLFLLFSMMGDSRRSRFVPLLLLCILFMGNVLMQFMLRFPYRVACPTIIISTLSLLMLPGFSVDRLKTDTGQLKASARCILMLCILCLIVFNGPVRWIKTWSLPLAETREKLAALNRLQEKALILREPGVIQITAYDPLDPAPLKSSDIGPGWLVGSPPYYARLHAFGVSSGQALMPASLDNPRILYFFKSANLSVLERYMAEHYHQKVRFVLADSMLNTSFSGFYKGSHLYAMQSFRSPVAPSISGVE